MRYREERSGGTASATRKALRESVRRLPGICAGLLLDHFFDDMELDLFAGDVENVGVVALDGNLRG